MNKKYTVKVAMRRTQRALVWLNALGGPPRGSITTFTRRAGSGSHGRLERD